MSGHMLGGVGWYRKTFEVPTPCTGRRSISSSTACTRTAERLVERRSPGLSWLRMEPLLARSDSRFEGDRHERTCGQGQLYRRRRGTCLQGRRHQSTCHAPGDGSGSSDDVGPGFSARRGIAADSATIRIQTDVQNESPVPTPCEITTRILDKNGKQVKELLLFRNDPRRCDGER